MRYIRVLWKHDAPDEPVELFSEIDERGWEVRKVERFRDGRFGYASPTEATEATGLGLEPVPSLEEVASDPQFVPEEISPADFERAWNQARSVAAAR